MSRIRHMFVGWLPPLFCAGLIFWLSTQPSLPDAGPNFRFKDKFAHFVMYGVLGWLTTRALRNVHGLPLPKAALWGIVLTALYGASDEWHQSFLPSRVPSLTDWLADVSGATLAQLVHWHDTRRGK